jgi:O-antigen ligase
LSYIIVAGLLVLAAAYYIDNNVYAVKWKISDSIEYLTGKRELDKVNLSTYATFSNSLVAYYSFRDNPIFGHGLGSHEISYFRYVINEKIVPLCGQGSPLNYNDAASLFSRLISETGLFGILAFFVFVFKFSIPKSRDRTGYLWIISGAALTMFFSKLLRMGHYFADGFFFFLWLYYFSKKTSENVPEAKDVVCR